MKTGITNATNNEKHIVASDEKAAFINARRNARVQGARLPSNAEIDALLFNESEDKLAMVGKMAQSSRYWWTNTVVVYPAPGEKLKRKFDVLDQHATADRIPHIFPSSQIPKEATKFKDMGIVLENPYITIERNRVVITPRHEPALVIPLPGASDDPGKMHDGSRLPIHMHSRAIMSLDENELRYLVRAEHQGIRPIARSFNRLDRWTINTHMTWDTLAGCSHIAVQQASAVASLGSSVQV